MDASPPPHPAANGQPLADARGARPVNWSLMRSVARASLFPFFLLSLGHYHSLTLVLADGLFDEGGAYPFVGGRFFWVSRNKRADAFISTVLAIAAVSFVLLCLSMVATISVPVSTNSGGRLALGESLSKLRGLWKVPSVARLYFTILLLGYVLSLVAVVVVSLVVVAGYSLKLGAWLVLLFLLALFLFLYLGLLLSVGLVTFVPEEAGRRGVFAFWSAVAFMEEIKLQGFIIFFVSLVIFQRLFLMGQLFWGKSFYIVGAIQLFPSAVLVNVIWMLGTCALFVYVGVLLQI